MSQAIEFPEMYCQFQNYTVTVEPVLMVVYFLAALGFMWLFAQLISVFQGKK